MSIDKLNSFISVERSRLENRHDNMFSFAFSQVARYYDFLILIQKKYEKISKQFIANLKEFQNSMDKRQGSHPMTQKQMEVQEIGAKITIKLHLEIESFYLFAKILLDKISRAIEFYFGNSRGLSLDSHDLLYKNIKQYAAEKKIEPGDEIIDMIAKLKEDISDFRDYQIAHHKNPRTIRGTMFNMEGETWLMLNSIYPKSNDKQVESKRIKDLIKSVDAYVVEVISFIEKNKNKTNLNLKK